MRRRDRFSISLIQLADLGSQLNVKDRSKLSISCCICYDARFVAASFRQNRPSDARQLIGERSRQNIGMQPFRRGCEPRSKTMLCPVRWSEQNNAGALHEQHAQVAIAPLADATKDRSVTRRHLLWHQP